MQDAPPINLLGQNTAYPQIYSPELLCPIARNGQRQTIASMQPFFGVDVWHAYEISWLNRKNKPQVAIMRACIDAHSPYLVESKSLKLYLNGFNQMALGDVNTVDDGQSQLQHIIQADLAKACQGPVDVQLIRPSQFMQHAYTHKMQHLQESGAYCLDVLDIEVDFNRTMWPCLHADKNWVKEFLYSDLLKSNCLVTHQPDWARVYIEYSGWQIEHASLLQYIIGFRNHQEFHEHCVERIFCDIMHHVKPQDLRVWAQYTRRGGIDITPMRSNTPFILGALMRHPRQ